MLRRFLVIAAGCLAICGLIFTPAESFARGPGGGGGGHFGGGGGHFGGGGFGGGGGHFGGFGGGHAFGGFHGFGGSHAFGGARAGGFHGRTSFAGRRYGGFHGRSHANVSRRTRTASRRTNTTRNARRFAGMHRATHSATARRSNRRSVAALHNRANRVANGRNLTAARAANTSRQNFANNSSFRHGNGFANARFGGHHWGNRGYGRFWAGGVFWPYFIGDYFSYAFWPDDYYGPFWGYGPDALLWGAFWPGYDYPYWDGGYYSAAYAGGQSSAGDIYRSYREAPAAQAPRRVSGLTPQESSASCAGFAPGVTALPIQRIAAILKPAPDQQAAFGDLKAAVEKASAILNEACPAETPLTPVARLDAMEQRLRAMQQAVDTIREPLERLYEVLSPAQKQQLDASVAGNQVPRGKIDLAKLCSSEAGFTNVPEEDIMQAINLDSAQMKDLDNLKQASVKASDILRDSCPANVPETLKARLDAAQKRIGALIEAIDAVRPEVKTFFASLSNEQKTALKSKAPGRRTASNRR